MNTDNDEDDDDNDNYYYDNGLTYWGFETFLSIGFVLKHNSRSFVISSHIRL